MGMVYHLYASICISGLLVCDILHQNVGHLLYTLIKYLQKITFIACFSPLCSCHSTVLVRIQVFSKQWDVYKKLWPTFKKYTCIRIVHLHRQCTNTALEYVDFDGMYKIVAYIKTPVFILNIQCTNTK